jgi:uncharacterized protein YecE (DUF72 family)
VTDPAGVAADASQFRLLEADAGTTPLVARTVVPWIDATPRGFVVDVRAHTLLTRHAAPAASLWPEVRDRLAPELRARPRLYAHEIPGRALDTALDRFVAALSPVHEAGKLGVALFPFPSYFLPTPRSFDYLAWLRDRSRELPLAVELRHREWLDSRHRAETLRFFEEHRLSYVCVDAPPGPESALPPLAVATADPVVIRFHGRDLDAWERGADTGEDRFPSGYRRADLEPWRPRIDKLLAGGHPVHAIFTTGTAETAGRDAGLLLRVLADDPARPAPQPRPRSGRK